MIPSRKTIDLKRSGSISVALPSRLRRLSHHANDTSADRARCEQRADRLAALLPDEDAEHDSTHAQDGQDGADDVHVARARVRRVLHELDPREHDQDHEVLAQERDAPGEVGRDEPSDERPDRGSDRGGGADQRVGLLLHRAGEVAVDQRLHGREQERRAEAADDRPEDDDREQALRQRHRQRADRIPEQPEHVGALASDQVADLASDQDECRGDERLERDRGLHAADGRVEIAYDGRDGHVHQRRVHHEHEHRHGEEDREPRVARRLLGRARNCDLARCHHGDRTECLGQASGVRWRIDQ